MPRIPLGRGWPNADEIYFFQRYGIVRWLCAAIVSTASRTLFLWFLLLSTSGLAPLQAGL